MRKQPDSSNLANQLTKSVSNRYVYDGYNRRIKTTDSHTQNKGTSYSMYSQAGKLLYRETADGGINYIFLGDKLIAQEGYGVKANTDSIMHYKPFGESIETPKDDVGYTGHKFDTDLGLSYMQARYYDPVIGRFYSNDPVSTLGHLGTSNGIHGFNRYAYANNNPYKYIDPDGKENERAISRRIKPVAKAVAEAIGGKKLGAKVEAHFTVANPNSSVKAMEGALKTIRGTKPKGKLVDSTGALKGNKNATKTGTLDTKNADQRLAGSLSKQGPRPQDPPSNPNAPKTIGGKIMEGVRTVVRAVDQFSDLL